jgi:tetratricopeptide (TPR) repeat protein
MRNDARVAFVNLGVVLTQQKRYPEALKALLRAVELDPAESDAHYQLSRVYRAMGNLEASRKEFEKVREMKQKADDLARQMPGSPPETPKVQ